MREGIPLREVPRLALERTEVGLGRGQLSGTDRGPLSDNEVSEYHTKYCCTTGSLCRGPPQNPHHGATASALRPFTRFATHFAGSLGILICPERPWGYHIKKHPVQP